MAYKLSANEKKLLIAVLFLSAIIRLIIVAVPFRWIVPLLGQHMKESPTGETENNLRQAQVVGRMIERVCRLTPWESKCLVQAITGKVILSFQGIGTTLYLGVCKETQNRLAAHAWLRCGEMTVTGGAGSEYFTVVSTFAD
ncbi:MAG TPA: lasso peptide biosynthesis B2 protein [Patescibacteria group bacterium]|nr:lasso peptide biosynthesis B2 protein [Patescibacteria group bacterium]